MRQDVTGFFMMLQGGWARGVRGFGPWRGVEWGFGPRRGVEIRARVRGGVEIRARARGGVGIFGVRWEIFYLFAVFSPFG